jgi:hypothetical protein
MTGFVYLSVAVTLAVLSRGIDYARLTPVAPLSPGACLLALAAGYAACVLVAAVVWAGLGLCYGED